MATDSFPAYFESYTYLLVLLLNPLNHPAAGCRVSINYYDHVTRIRHPECPNRGSSPNLPWIPLETCGNDGNWQMPPLRSKLCGIKPVETETNTSPSSVLGA